MDLMISEVQITCIILMGLITLFLAFAISRYTVVGKTYDFARKILTFGTLLVTLHFIVQYTLHKNAYTDVASMRTLVNLSFGIPMSYFFNLSNYYILRKGKVGKLTWLLSPVIFVLALCIFAVCAWIGCLWEAAYIMSFLYGITLVYYGLLQIREYYRVVHSIRAKEDFSLLPYIKWTQWSVIFFVVVAFGFPFMTFCTNLLMRSLYGLLAVSSGFFYVLSFMGYGINGAVSSKYARQLRAGVVSRQSMMKRTMAEEEDKQERMLAIINEFIKNGSYLRNGITQKEAADEMGISAYRLKSWLHNSEFETFSRWIVYLRLVRAKDMLKENPEIGCDHIAESCGFCDRQYFQRSFRKWTGMTPTQWVKNEELGQNSPETDDESSSATSSETN